MFERNHQEFSYGASKIIFYMNEDTEIKEKKKLINLPSMNKRRIQTKTTDLNHRVKRVCELAKQNEKCADRSKLTSRASGRQKYSKKNKQNNPKSKINVRGAKAEKQKIPPKSMKKCRTLASQEKIISKISANGNLLALQSVINRSRESVGSNKSLNRQRKSCFSKIQEERSSKRKSKYLNHSEIRSLFGGHHQFYTPEIDYLTKHNLSGKNQYMNLTDKQLALETQLMNLKSQELKQKRLNIKNQFSSSHFYQFNGQRADIVKYLNHLSSEGKHLYPILIQRKCENQRYIDEEFSSQNMKKINKKQVFWFRLEPKTNLQIFPRKFAENLIKFPENQKPLPFLSFLNCLSLIQPEIFMRLYEPSYNNIFSLWLFLKGKYEPIYVDGDFPFNQAMNPLYGYVQGYPWYSILVKCLAKMVESYSFESLEKITPSNIYELFTGMKPITVKVESLKNTEELFELLNFYSSMTPILHSLNVCEIIKVVSVEKDEIKLQNPNSKYSHTIRADQILMDKGEIIFINPEYNWFIYSLDFVEGNMTKFDLQCLRKTEILFKITSLPDQNSDNRWIYIYESTYCKNKREKVLNLKHQLKAKNMSKIFLKRGNYVVFLEIGKKKIGEFFNGDLNKQQENQTNYKRQKSHCFTVLSSQEVKLSKGVELGKNFYGKYVEDSHSLYCPSSNRGKSKI